jgi:hypothetical protein
MIPVDLITEVELNRRLATLPDKLKESLESERNVTIVAQICAKNRIADEEKILIINQIVGLVLLGFVHDYDVAAEINDELDLNNPQFSKAIGDELSAKIFDPIKAELDANYHPVVAGTGDVVPPPAAVATSLPVAPIAKSPAPPPAPKIVSSVIPNKPVASAPTGAATPPPVPMPPPVAPPPVFAKGWSTIQPGDFPPQAKPPVPATPPPVKNPALGEFARLGIKEDAPRPASGTAVPPATGPAMGPGPVMLHEDINLKPLQKSPDFRLVRPSDGMAMGTTPAKQEAPLKAAVLELGKTNEKTSPPPASAPSSMPSVPKLVHYTEFIKASTPGVPPMSAPGRSVTEIISPSASPAASKPTPMPIPPKPPTAPPPPPPVPPRPVSSMPPPPIPKPVPPSPAPAGMPPPPSAPKPPQAPQPPTPTPPPGKIISKDYL